MKRLNLLLVEDRPADAELTLRELRRSGLQLNVHVVKDEKGYCQALRPSLDLIICDHNLPQFNSIHALTLLKSSGYDIPFIIVSGMISEEVAVECMKLGAADYLLKDRLTRLVPAINQAMAQKQLREDKRRAHAAAHILAEAGMVLASSLKLDLSVQQLVEMLVERFADFSDIWTFTAEDKKRFRPLASAHRSSVVLKSAPFLKARIAFQSRLDCQRLICLGASEAILIRRLSMAAKRHGSEGASYQGMLLKLGLVSVIAVPLEARGQKLGEMVFARTKSQPRFDEADCKLAIELAHRTALAIDNAKLYQQAQEALRLQTQAHEEAKRLYREAQVAHRLKDEFLATVSHELRTPLSAILGFSEIIRDRSLPPAEIEHAIEIIHRNAKSQFQLISDLLDISRIITGRMELKKRPVKLPEVVESAVESLQLALAAKALKIKTDYDGQVRPLLGDEDRLQQVVWNLLTNAIKFTPKGGTIRVELRDEESKIELSVQDSGKGIDPAFLPYVFDNFRQENSSLTREFGGLGLGLAIVRQIVELHGGEVAAISQGSGKGATFTVRLPVLAIDVSPRTGLELREYLDKKSRTEDERSLAGEDVQRRPSGPLQGIEVMIIDDSKDARDLVKIFLETAGAIVIPVESSQKALEILEKIKPHVLICDIGMPEMDGFTFIKTLRSREQGKTDQIPAAALTAFAGEEYKKQAMTYGFQAHVAKPVEIGQLIDIVSRLSKKAMRPR